MGTGADAHYTLPNGVAADFFCSAASVLPNGTVLIADGDLTINGDRGYSNDDSTIFNPRTNTLVSGPQTNQSLRAPCGRAGSVERTRLTRCTRRGSGVGLGGFYRRG